MSRRSNLLPPYLAANPAWTQLVEAIDEVFANEVDLPTQLLAKLRDNWILGAAGEAKVGDDKMLDNADWFRFERETLIRQANQLGFLLKETDLLTDEEYQRVVRNLGAFWYNKGTPEFIDFIRFILGSIIDLRKLYALPGPTYDTYGYMREEGDTLIGRLNHQFEEEYTPLFATDINAADTVANGGAWTMGPNAVNGGRVIGPTGLMDAVVVDSNNTSGSYMTREFALENNTTYDLEVWVRRLNGALDYSGHMRVDSDFDNIADAVERQQQAFGDIPLVWVKKTMRFKTGMFASLQPANIAYTAGADPATIIAYAQPQLKKVVTTSVLGQWFETSHVNLVVDPLQYQVGTLEKVVALFNALANYHLVLNTIMFEFSPYIHPPGEDIGVIVKAYPMIDIEPLIYTRSDPLPPTVTNVSSPTWTEGGDLIFIVTLDKSSSVPNNYTYNMTTTGSSADYDAPVFSNGVAVLDNQLQVPPDVSSFTVTYALKTDDSLGLELPEVIATLVGPQVGEGFINEAGWTYSGGVNGMIMGPAGLYVPKATPAFEYDRDTKAVKGLRVRGLARVAAAWPSRPPVGNATYYTTDDAPGIVTGQLARKYTRILAGTPPFAFTGGMNLTGTGQQVTHWSIVEQDPASPQPTSWRVIWYDNTTPQVYAQLNFDVSTGTPSSIITPAGSGYFLTLLSNSGPNGGKVWLCGIYATLPNDGKTYIPYAYMAGNVGQTGFFHHRQSENGIEVAPTPIITTTAAVSRTGDRSEVLNLSTKPWWSAAEGTVLVEFQMATDRAYASDRVWEIIGADANNRILVYVSGATASFQVRAAGSDVASLNAGGLPALGVTAKIVVSWKADRFLVSRDGAAPNSDTGGALPSGLTTFMLGHENGGAQGNVIIKALRHWNVAANATEIASITKDTNTIAG